LKKFNLFKEIITVNKAALLQALNSAKEFAITTQGVIVYAPFEKKEPYIFQGKHTPKPTNLLTPSATPTLSSLLGENYQVVEDEERVLIKAFSNWQEIIRLNISHASYDDTTADGVAEFSNPALEDIGWNATEFEISYRELIGVLEERSDGVLLCIEQEDPYRFSGLGFIADDKEAYNILFGYCQEKIQELMQTQSHFAKEKLSEDELDAAEFFEVL
jgi:hypothetical protein